MDPRRDLDRSSGGGGQRPKACFTVGMRLTNAQWTLIAPLVIPRRRNDGRGRPPQNLRPVVEGILWVLRTGARWRDMPKEYPPHQTCWRWFDRWSKDGTWLRVRGALLRHLDEAGKLNWDEGFIDATPYLPTSSETRTP